MRLLKLDSRGELSLTDNLIKDIPPYAILSHTWGAEGSEVTFNDLGNGSGKRKAGYDKVQFCGEQARKDSLQYFWVDTCCIDKSNIPELQRAINSMFCWYRDAEKCYVYLSDVAVRTDDNNQTERTWEPAFRESRWFTRGWTLQELIAPRSVEFFSRERELLGSKKTLEQQIHEITDLPIGALRGAPLSDFSIEEQLRWAEKRETTWEEDKAYCLLGMFDVSTSLRYGEGHRAFGRLKKKISAFSASHEKGLNLFDAPDIGEGLFIGREQDLLSMENVLQPQSNSINRRVLILGGMGGIGKTQLAVKYANKHHDFYSSIFWLNATSEVTMRQSLRTIANRIFPPETVIKWEDDQVWIHASNWFSEAENGRWLLIFDNHDDPDLYTITKYYPSAMHGSILITTRQPGRINGEMVRVSSMVKEEDSLRILATRSGRNNVESDPDARKLVERLDGHPLALATAGAFLSQSALNFKKYLAQYEAKWKVTDCSKQLSDYPSRTLYTTWDLSFRQIEQQNVRAANLLRLLAYFDHQDIWYELLQSGHGEDQPPWFTDLASDEFAFEDAMQTLTRYCLVEAHHETESYSLHVCVHDWTLKGLNAVVDENRYWLTFDCVASHISTADWDDLSALRFRRFVPHTMRLVHESFQDVRSRPERLCLTETHALAVLLTEQVQYKAAERMYRRTLAVYEQALGPDHTSTLDAVHNLGNLYRDQCKLALAEEFYLRALTGCEQALGPDHTSTLDSVNCLGNLYRDQGKLALAEEFYLRALTGYEQALGPDHTSTLEAVHNLGNLYGDQGKLALAEEFYLRALTGYEQALGPDHTSTLLAVNNLGSLYGDQGKLALAEEFYLRALTGYEQALGPDHTSTLDSVHCLGILYTDQGKLALAEEFHLRALTGYEQALGPDHTSTLDSVHNLGNLYRNQLKLALAEEFYLRALTGYEQALGPDHTSTLLAVHNLGNLYWDQGKLVLAEEFYLRALIGCEQALGPDHTSTLDSVHCLGNLYRDQCKLALAEEFYLLALTGYEQALGPDHTSTLLAVNHLGNLYRDQGKLVLAEEFYLRALAGYEKVSQSETIPALNTARNLGLLYRDQGQTKEAEKMFQRAVLGREKVLALDHPHTLAVTNDLSKLRIVGRNETRVKVPIVATIYQGKEIA